MAATSTPISSQVWRSNRAATRLSAIARSMMESAAAYSSMSRESGIIQHCDIFANKGAGVQIQEGGNPTIRNCEIHDSKEDDGVYVLDEGRGIFESCNIFANKLAGVRIKKSGDPTISDCQIRDNQEASGVLVSSQGKGTIDGCEIFANSLGLTILEGSDPTVRDCKIHDSKLSGVAVSDQSKGVIECCEIFANKFGVGIIRGGDPNIRKCKIHHNLSGVAVSEQGKGISLRTAISSPTPRQGYQSCRVVIRVSASVRSTRTRKVAACSCSNKERESLPAAISSATRWASNSDKAVPQRSAIVRYTIARKAGVLVWQQGGGARSTAATSLPTTLPA